MILPPFYFPVVERSTRNAHQYRANDACYKHSIS